MSDRTGITWATSTWNPVTGCAPIGECRRRAPTFMPTRNDDRDEGSDNAALWGHWPKVMGGSWCGEFDTEK